MPVITSNKTNNRPHEILEFNGTKLPNKGFITLEKDTNTGLVLGLNKYQFSIGRELISKDTGKSYIKWYLFHSCLGHTKIYDWDVVYDNVKSIFINLCREGLETCQEEISKIPERVDRGIQWFAELGFSLEDLEDEITPEIFDMAICESCIVGQVLGNYWHAQWKGTGISRGEFLGFWGSTKLNEDEDLDEYYNALELEWAKRLGFCKECLPNHKGDK